MTIDCRSLLACFAAVLTVVSSLTDQTSSSTAVLSGVLITDGAAASPVRRAMIRLSSSAGMSPRLAGTDVDGRFAFHGLPAGTYTLSATKPGFVTAFHGSHRAGRGPGVPIAIAGGARVEVTLRMLPGASISGTLTDANGTPMSGVSIIAVDLRAANPVSERAVTDDRGMYRIFGLAPGDYVVSAVPRLLPTLSDRAMATSAEIIAVTDAEARWARGVGVPGQILPSGRPVAYAPVFFPGTTDIAAAQTVSLGTGEERTGLSMTTAIVSVATISGALVDAGGQPVSPATVSLHPRRRDRPSAADALVKSGALTLPRGRVTASGFSIAGVAPGDYTIVARSGAGTRGAPPPDPGAPGMLWSVADLNVDGNDQRDLMLRMLPGLQLSGAIAMERSVPGGDPGGVEVMLTASGPSLGAASALRAIVDRRGTFRFTGIPPGTYRLAATAPAPGGPWLLKSAMLNGRDLADWPLEVKSSGEEVAGLTITFTNRITEIAGRLVDATGRPVTRYSIVVFAVDRTLWLPGSRRVTLTQPATDGSFEIAGLPPGEYAIAAAEDADADDLADSAFLSQLLASSVKLTLAEGEKKRQDLRVTR